MEEAWPMSNLKSETLNQIFIQYFFFLKTANEHFSIAWFSYFSATDENIHVAVMD